jgi:hypothetical protein
MFTRHLHLLTALHALGATADDVANTLELGGWSGRPGDACNCPIAQYLVDMIPDATSAAVSESAATVFLTDARTAETVMPAGAAAFVDRFDDGAYPYLVDHSDPE